VLLVAAQAPDRGIHHFVTPKHLAAYVNESAWRFNLRGIA